MKSYFALVLALIFAAPVFAQPAPARDCVIETGHKGSDAIVSRSIRFYACGAADGTRVPVSKAWFKQHCYRYSDNGATCYVYAEAAKVGEKLATPPGFLHHLGEDALYVGIGVLILFVIANGGGGAFQ